VGSPASELELEELPEESESDPESDSESEELEDFFFFFCPWSFFPLAFFFWCFLAFFSLVEAPLSLPSCSAARKSSAQVTSSLSSVPSLSQIRYWRVSLECEEKALSWTTH